MTGTTERRGGGSGRRRERGESWRGERVRREGEEERRRRGGEEEDGGAGKVRGGGGGGSGARGAALLEYLPRRIKGALDVSSTLSKAPLILRLPGWAGTARGGLEGRRTREREGGVKQDGMRARG
eukprot:2300527-Rhodomonas_salina.1